MTDEPKSEAHRRVLQNKRRGHQREIEMARRSQSWPIEFQMERTGLDGGHDLRGKQSIGEVKAVRKGPVWLSGGLSQLDNTEAGTRNRFLFVCLSSGPGKPVRWVVVESLEEWEARLDRLHA